MAEGGSRWIQQKNEQTIMEMMREMMMREMMMMEMEMIQQERKKHQIQQKTRLEKEKPCIREIQEALVCYTVTLNKNIYKKRFESTIEVIQKRKFTTCQTKYIMKQLNLLSREKPHYCIYDTMFALCLTLFSKRQRLTEQLTESRLFALTQRVCLRTSSPSQATCLLQCMLAHCLQQNGRLFESLHILTENLKQTDLDTVCTFNCHRLLDIIDAMRGVFEDSNDDRFLEIMLTHIYEGFAQIKAIDSTCVDDLTEEFRENASYCVLKKAQSQLPEDSVLTSNVNLLKAIVNVDASKCELAIKEDANVIVCLHALFRTIKLGKHVAHVGSDLYHYRSSSVEQRHKELIDCLLTKVDEDAIEQATCILYDGDSRRKTLLDGICLLLQKEPSRLNLDQEISPVKIQFGYFCNNSNFEECFLVQVNTNENIGDKSFAGIKVIFRNAQQVSAEGMEVEMSQKKKDNPLSDDDYEIIRDTIKKHGKYLWSAHSNLNMISACPLKSSEQGVKLVCQPCIVLYCSFKGFIPNNEPKFPRTLSTQKKDIPVDVREGRFHLGCLSKPTDYHRFLVMGGSVSLSGRDSAGTIGPFIQLPNGETGFITCAHVFFDIPLTSTTGLVDQPSHIDIADIPDGQTKQCGKIYDAYFDDKLSTGIDAALVEITQRVPDTGSFAYNDKHQIKAAGFDPDHPPIFNNGSFIREIKSEQRRMPVIKSGRTTGMTVGMLHLDGVEVAIRDREYTVGANTQSKYYFKRTYEVSSCNASNLFFQKGDSGAGVFMIGEHNELSCIGIGIGCTDKGTAIVTPIGPILDHFNLPGLKQFPEDMDQSR